MNINKTAKAFAIAAVVGMSSQVFAATTNNWWNIDFQDATTMTALTNPTSYSAVGQWSTAAGDESSIQTNESNVYLKLDTQGQNLTWTPLSNSVSSIVLVDSDIYLVGSDSEPKDFDTDSGNPVQTAVYLKNYIDANNVTTGSVLCAYVWDAIGASNKWVELGNANVSMVDTNWYNVRIVVTYAANSSKVQFFVKGSTQGGDNYLMADASDNANFDVANFASFVQPVAQKVNSVSFRGTGSIDNFMGSQVIPDAAATLTFSVTTLVTNVVDETVGNNGASEMMVLAGTPWFVSFSEYAASGAVTNYLNTIRVITNGVVMVDYACTYGGSEGSWTFVPTATSPMTLAYDGATGGVRLNVNTTGFTQGYDVEAYYGAAPAGGGNPDPTIPTVIQPIAAGTTPAVAFETIGVVEYFAVSFVAPEAGILYTLQTSTTLGGTFADETDPLAKSTSTSVNQEITLSAPTGGATTKFYRIKASTVGQ